MMMGDAVRAISDAVEEVTGDASGSRIGSRDRREPHDSGDKEGPKSR